jgi:NADPH-dependent glutamate synthase beta subunit-like oxidoreductase
MSTSSNPMPRNPYLEYDPEALAGMAAACATCPDPAPCTQACTHSIDITAVMQLAGRAACEGLALARWTMSAEELESARITDAIADRYNG